MGLARTHEMLSELRRLPTASAGNDPETTGGRLGAQLGAGPSPVSTLRMSSKEAGPWERFGGIHGVMGQGVKTSTLWNGALHGPRDLGYNVMGPGPSSQPRIPWPVTLLRERRKWKGQSHSDRGRKDLTLGVGAHTVDRSCIAELYT